VWTQPSVHLIILPSAEGISVQNWCVAQPKQHGVHVSKADRMRSFYLSSRSVYLKGVCLLCVVSQHHDVEAPVVFEVLLTQHLLLRSSMTIVIA
jgi:hypothetical protein